MKINNISLYISILALLFFLQSCEKKKEIISNTKYDSKLIEQYLKKAEKFYDNSKYESSFYYANKAKTIIDPKRNYKEYVRSMMFIAVAQQVQGDYSGCESTLTEAIPYIEKSNNQKHKWKFYSLLAENYSFTLNYNEAIYYFTKTINLKVDSNRKLNSLINIGYTYIQKRNYIDAIKILEPLISKKVESLEDYSATINNLGYCYYKIGAPKAIKYLTEALNTTTKIKNDWGLTANYFYLYEYYSRKDEKEAVKYANLLYHLATKLKDVDDRLLALSLLIKHSSGNELKKHSLNYVHINDSITKVRQKAKNYFAKIKYDFKREKEENEILKTQRALEQEQQKNKDLLFYFIIIIGLITTLFIYYYLITKNKKEKIKVSYNTEVRIAKKLHDELANDVYHTMAFAETQDLSTHSNKEKLLHNLDTIYTRTRNISKENSAINTDDLFLPNLKEMMLGFSTDTVNILTNGMETIHWEKIKTFKKITVYRVLQELLVNMKKHSNCSLVILLFKENENQLEINYTDNGIGVTEEQLTSKNGLKNAENRILAIKGSISFDTTSDTGFKVNIRFPI